MKFKNIIIVGLILLIVAVNGITVFWLLRNNDTTQCDDFEIKEKTSTVQPIFGKPDSITVVCDGERFQVSDEKYDEILYHIENSHKYVESFTSVDSFTADDELLVELDYDTPHRFTHGAYDYDVTSVKINLYNASGDMLIRTTEGEKFLGSLNITAEFIEAIKSH